MIKKESWTEVELMLTMYFYIHFGRLGMKSKKLITFTDYMNNYTGNHKSYGSISLRIANYAVVDPFYVGKGMNQGGGNIEGRNYYKVWHKYYHNQNKLNDLYYKMLLYNNDESNNRIFTKSIPMNKIIEQVKKNANCSVSYIKKSIKVYNRNVFVKEYILRVSNGICSLCGHHGPFKTEQDEYFLEVHHINFLSEGGTDSIENTIALCPNCHRKMHVVRDSSDIEKLKSIANDRSTAH